MRRDVKNKSCKYWKRVWVYTWSWLEWGKNKYNNPWGGEWTFDFDWWSLRWTWNSKWAFLKGSLDSDWKIYEITGSRYLLNDWSDEQTELSVLEWKRSVNLAGKTHSYSVEIGRDFKLQKIIYKWVTINLEHSGWATYLKSSKGKLKLWFVDEEVAAMWIAKCIDIVKNSGRDLDFFETEGVTLQADYEDKVWDTNLLRNCQSKFWVDAYSLAAWLNACRHTDFGI